MSNYPPRLAPEEIKYIALEGGGGKGNAFVGALESLAHSSLNVIQNSGYRLTNIRGVAGASAGAITSMFLAAGFTPIELKTITDIEDFNLFFDPPNPGRVFRIGGFQTLTAPTDPQTLALTDIAKEFVRLMIDLDVTRMAAYVARHVHVSDIVRSLRELDGLLSTVPTSVPDAAEALLRIREVIERLTELGISDTLSALEAVREILTALPAAVWGHLVQLCLLHARLIRLRIQAAWMQVLFANINQTLLFIRSHLSDATIQTLLNRDPEATATAIVQDFGFLTGEEIYKFFRRWLAVARMRVNTPTQYQQYLSAAGGDIPTCFRNLKGVVESRSDAALTRYFDDPMTFETFEQEFQIQLVLTGTNLESLTSHVFSGATTPRFYVVDAVRLSMALPYCIFKPLVIREDDPALPDVIGSNEHLRERDPVSQNRERHPLIGVWVDGGLFNNIPSHVFDRETGTRAGETLALRLDSSFQELPSSVTSITDYFRRFPGGIIFGTGEALASRSYDNKYRSIALDTGNMNLLSFDPPAADVIAVRQSAIQYVFRYFDVDVPTDL